jgi:hypothetical protein
LQNNILQYARIGQRGNQLPRKISKGFLFSALSAPLREHVPLLNGEAFSELRGFLRGENWVLVCRAGFLALFCGCALKPTFRKINLAIGTIGNILSVRGHH